MKILHIGLGKTGTTFLQRWVFGDLCSQNKLEFNNNRIVTLFRKFMVFKLSPDEMGFLSSYLNDEEYLISNEDLLDWNPEQWIYSLEKIRSIAPNNLKIFITVRDPYAFLTSLYLQALREGNIIHYDKFFLDDTTYDQIYFNQPPSTLMAYPIEKFNLVELEAIVRKYFEDVCFYNIARGLSGPEVSQSLGLKYTVNDNQIRSKPSNLSITRRHVALLLMRDKFIRKLGFRSISGFDYDPRAKWESINRKLELNFFGFPEHLSRKRHLNLFSLCKAVGSRILFFNDKPFKIPSEFFDKFHNLKVNSRFVGRLCR